MKRNGTVSWAGIAVWGLGACVFAGDPAELTTIRQQYDRSIEQTQQEHLTKERRLQGQYLQSLDLLMQSLTRAGRLDAALAVRAEKTRIAELLGQQPDAVQEQPLPKLTTRPTAPLSTSKSLVRDRDALLAEAKGALTPEQYAISEKMRFKEFKFEAAKSGSYCNMEFSTTANVENILNSDLTARVRYLCRNADKKFLVLDGGKFKVKPAVKSGTINAGSNMGTEYVMKNNNANGVPLNAHITISFYGVPIYEALWKTAGEPARYTSDGKTPWWQDESLVQNAR